MSHSKEEAMEDEQIPARMTVEEAARYFEWPAAK
jgi:hypothetical protein